MFTQLTLMFAGASTCNASAYHLDLSNSCHALKNGGNILYTDKHNRVPPNHHVPSGYIRAHAVKPALFQPLDLSLRPHNQSVHLKSFHFITNRNINSTVKIAKNQNTARLSFACCCFGCSTTFFISLLSPSPLPVL